MAIYPDPPTTFIPAPEGQHSAVCCDVVDLGVMEMEYNGQKRKSRKVRLVFQIDEQNDNSKPFTVSRMFTNSLHQKAALRSFLNSWRGTPITDAATQRFDLETLIGVPALLQVIHKDHDGTTWANIDSIMRLPNGYDKLEITDYVRLQDRDNGVAVDDDEKVNTAEDSGGDIPF